MEDPRNILVYALYFSTIGPEIDDWSNRIFEIDSELLDFQDHGQREISDKVFSLASNTTIIPTCSTQNDDAFDRFVRVPLALTQLVVDKMYLLEDRAKRELCDNRIKFDEMITSCKWDKMTLRDLFQQCSSVTERAKKLALHSYDQWLDIKRQLENLIRSSRDRIDAMTKEYADRKEQRFATLKPCNLRFE